jgi:hypothetical protein
MKTITFKPKKGQNKNTIITLPTGVACRFRNGKFTTNDPSITVWLMKLGYEERKKPGRKKSKPKGEGHEHNGRD